MNPIFERHSVRHFDGRSVCDDDIRRIVEAGCAAPSSKNEQPWKVVVIKQPRLSKIASELRDIAEKLPDERKGSVTETFSIMGTAPVCLFVFLESKWQNPRFFAHMQSVGAFIENMLIEAQSLGIGSLWCGDVLEVDIEAARLLGTESYPVAALLFGYENNGIFRKKHKTPEDLLIRGYDEW